jgi:hypothetical protein
MINENSADHLTYDLADGLVLKRDLTGKGERVFYLINKDILTTKNYTMHETLIITGMLNSLRIPYDNRTRIQIFD